MEGTELHLDTGWVNVFVQGDARTIWTTSGGSSAIHCLTLPPGDALLKGLLARTFFLSIFLLTHLGRLWRPAPLTGVAYQARYVFDFHQCSR
jgi:hypothetical protein